MRRIFSGGALVLALVGAVAADCCDPDHDALKANEQAAEVCKERGGVAVVTRTTDGGGHTFLVLKQCSFPTALRLEKGT